MKEILNSTRTLLCGLVGVSILFFSGTAYASLLIDQLQVEIDTSTNMVIGGADKVQLAQVMTVGFDGDLTEIRVPVACTTGDLTVEVQGVSGETPNGIVTTSEVILGSGLPVGTPFDFVILTLSTPVAFTAGDRFAIVLKSDGECRISAGPVGNPYPGGDGYYLIPNPVLPDVWVRNDTRIDLPFIELAYSLSRHGHASLDGRQEVPDVSTQASGRYQMMLRSDGNVEFILLYQDLEGSVEEIHMHYGRADIVGGIAAFLCTNLGNGPAGTQTCPDPPPGLPVLLRGTIDTPDIVGPAAQGVAPGELDKLQVLGEQYKIYIDIHTSAFPNGEIRGRMTGR